MTTKTTSAISAVKQEVRLGEWAEQVRARQESGMTVQKWCAENGISPKTYYYHLRRVREQCMDYAPSIVPVTIPDSQSTIRIEKNGMLITLPSDVAAETLTALVREIC